MQIHAAAARGDLASIEWCLSRGVPIDVATNHGDTALIIAIYELHNRNRTSAPGPTEETLRFLLDRGANPNLPGYLGRTAAHAASSTHSVAALRLLRSAGADLLAPDDGATTFIRAASARSSKRKPEVLRYLLEHGAAPNFENHADDPPIIYAAQSGDWETVRLLLQFGVNPDPLRWGKLHHAVVFGNLDEVRACIAPSVDREERDCWDQTAFLLAVKHGSISAAKLLIEAGWSRDARGRCGITALGTAARAGATAMLEWLLAHGADANGTNEFGDTVLMEAAESDALSCVESLLRFGADPITADDCQIRAIHHATSLPVARALIAADSESVNAISGTGEWPLKISAERNDVQFIEGLLLLGAEVDLTSTGATALHAAINYDSREAAERLLCAGADPNAADVDGWTPLCSARSREAVQLLLAHGADHAAKDECGSRPKDCVDDPLVAELLT